MAVFSGNGSNTAPSFTFSSDTNTGMYREDTDKIGFASNGGLKFYISETSVRSYNNFGIGMDPARSLDILTDVGVQAQIKCNNSGNGQNVQLQLVGGNPDSTGLVLGQNGSGNTVNTDAFINAARTNSDLRFQVGGTTAITIDGNSTSNTYRRTTVSTDSTFGLNNFRVYIATFGSVNNTNTRVLDLNPLDDQGRYIWLFAGKHNNQNVWMKQGISFVTGNFSTGSWSGSNTIYVDNNFTSLSMAVVGNVIQATWTGTSASASSPNYAICLVLGAGSIFEDLDSTNGLIS